MKKTTKGPVDALTRKAIYKRLIKLYKIKFSSGQRQKFDVKKYLKLIFFYI